MNVNFGSKLVIKAQNQEGLKKVAQGLQEASNGKNIKTIEQPQELLILTGKDSKKFEDSCDLISKTRSASDVEYHVKNLVEDTKILAPVLDLKG